MYKMVKKFLTTITVVSSILIVSACNNSAKTQPTPTADSGSASIVYVDPAGVATPTPEPKPTPPPAETPKAPRATELTKKYEGKTIVMGTNAEFPPFEFVADNEKGLVGKFDGVDVAIAKEIADKLGAELVIDNMEFDSLIMALQSGKIDFIAAGMTANAEREENVDFTDKYYKAVQYIIVRSDNKDIITIKDLEDKVVGVQQGTTGDYTVEDGIPVKEVKRYNRGIDAVMELKSNKIDAVVIDSMPATVFTNADPEIKLIKNQSMVVINGSTVITSIMDTENARIGVLKDSLAKDIVLKERKQATMKEYDNLEDAKKDLLANEIDLIIAEDTLAEKLINESNHALAYPSKDNNVFGTYIFETEEYAIAVQKGNTELRDSINTVIDELKENGKIEEFITNYSK